MNISLEEIRNEIDKIDECILNLLSLRMSLIPRVAKVKLEKGLPLYQALREQNIFEKNEAFGKKNSINYEMLNDIYKLIIKESLSIEHAIAEKHQRTKR